MKQQTTRNFQGSATGIIITCVHIDFTKIQYFNPFLSLQFYLFWHIDYNIMAPDFISSSL